MGKCKLLLNGVWVLVNYNLMVYGYL